jgi:hypothetical protein
MTTYGLAAGALRHLLPVTVGTSPETLRGHTLQMGEKLGSPDIAAPTVAAAAITVRLDSTFIRGRRDSRRHLEVRVGKVETEHGARQALGGVAQAGTDVAALLRRSLRTVGRNVPCQV